MSHETSRMTSHRPYLVRALAEWIADNDMTPHLLVDASVAGVRVPPSAINDGKVVLNIAQRAVSNLLIDNTSVSFSARFGGVSYPVLVPISAVLAIYSRETGQGMALPEDVNDGLSAEDQGDDLPPDDTPPEPTKPSGEKRPSFLRVVK